MIKSAFWMVIVVILCCFLCACINAPQRTNDTILGPTIIDKTPREGPAKVSFETAWAELAWYDSTGTIDLTNATFHQIYGSNVDIGGNASSWILGVKQGDNSSLLIYESEEWRRVAWGEPFTSPMIEIETILLPTQLYDKNHQHIEEAMSKGEVNETYLDLSSGIYTISLRKQSDIIHIYRFDAISGESLS